MLENRLVGGRFWLPSRQEIEIRRDGTWLDYPARGIIRGRWEIGDYQFNLGAARRRCSPDRRSCRPRRRSSSGIRGRAQFSIRCRPMCAPSPTRTSQRVQEEARALVRAQALARAQHVTLSARNVSDIARFDRVEGLAIGDRSLEAVRARADAARPRAGMASTIGMSRAPGRSPGLRPSGLGVSPVRLRATSATSAT